MKSKTSPQIILARSLGLLVVMAMLLGLACSLPGKPTPEPTATEAPTATATVKPAAPLPPAVIETSPLPQSVINAGDGLTIYFNQDMDRASVEAALDVQPVGGAVEWVNDATLRVVPTGNLEPATDITVTVGEGALAANRLALGAPVSFTYQTPDALRYTERLPKPGAEWVAASSAVAISFNQPVVALGADGPGLPAAFTLEPPVDGQGEWLNTSTYVFYPEPTLSGGVTYTVTLNPELVSTAGAPLDPDYETTWQFNVALPDIINVEPETEIPVHLDDVFAVTFNQPMDRPSTERAFRLLDESGALTPVTYSWDEDSNKLTLTPITLLARETRYTLQQSEGALGLGGTPMQGYRDIQYITVPPLALIQTRPTAGSIISIYGGYTSGFSLIFSAPLLREQDWEALITVTPAVESLEFYAYETEIYASGYFAPNTEYSVTISGALLDEWGGAMIAPTTIEFLTGGLEPNLVMPAAELSNDVVTVLPWESGLTAQVTGVSQLNLELGEISLSEMIRALYVGVDAGGMTFDTSWTLPIRGNTDQVTTITVPLQPSGQPLQRGIYTYHATAPGLSNYQEKFFYIVVSQTQLLVKRSQDTVFVWAVDLASQTPVA
ncbi:MAG TPA: Ig-like domain-containing protein, partial [Anaerolineaceae bacterium]|nr:Ig-like domain-containing protein [Anaerolineaceae bacterium]